MAENSLFPRYKTVPTADLIPYARNARTHSEAQVAKLAASIREFGFLNPIITDGKNGIVAGHGRVMAAQKLGLQTLPVIEAAHLTEAQKRAYILADNRLALDAGWDNEMARIELEDLQAQGFDLALTGFELGEVENLLDLIPTVDGRQDSGPANGSLAERFLIPPFSVLNAREGWWQDRKRAWLDLGIRSELGRGEGDRACIGGSPMPGNGSRKDYKPGAAKAFHDGAALGKGGLADQVAAAAHG
jgi:hypothetical protein